MSLLLQWQDLIYDAAAKRFVRHAFLSIVAVLFATHQLKSSFLSRLLRTVMFEADKAKSDCNSPEMRLVSWLTMLQSESVKENT